MLIRAERIHACAVGRQCTRTAILALHAEQNLVRAIRITADIFVFLVVDPVPTYLIVEDQIS